MEASAAVTLPAAATTAPPDIAPIVPGAPPVQIVRGENRPWSGSTPTLRIVAPHAGQLIESARVELSLQTGDWSPHENGNAILLFVDEAPPITLHELHVDDLRGLLRAHQVELTEGSHWLRALASSASSGTVKSATAFAVLAFHFKRRGADFDANPNVPWLSVAAPNGCFELGSRVPLDFYAANTQLGSSAQRVHYSLDDDALAGDITDDAPRYIENIPAGEHSLRLRLRDAGGAEIASAHDSGVNVFRVASTCATGAQPAATSAAQTSGAGAAARPVPPEPAR
jgi:hypothetical protein